MPESPAHILVETRNGSAFLPELNLWLDPRRRKDLAFVSHAHSDHFGPHRELICSQATRHLLKQRYRPKNTEFLGVEFGEAMPLAGHTLRLLPAGHIAGSAQLHVERDADGASLLYTGDFKLRPGFAAETSEWRYADTLIMETTFGWPQYRLPPADEVMAAMVAFARETLAGGGFPVFLAYSLGKAQEILLGLHRLAPEFSFCLHPAAARMTEAVGSLGYEFPPFQEADPKKMADSDPTGLVHIQPPMGRRAAALGPWKQARFAMVTGWALDKSARYRYGVDAAFALSDHADYDDLLRCVESRVRPRRVITLHGFAREFANDLRARGWEAWSLEGGDQMEFPLFSPTPTPEG
jgi:DNA ligase-1